MATAEDDLIYDDNESSDNGPEELAEPDDPFIAQDDHELATLEYEILDLWEAAEKAEPSDPYYVLKVKPGDSNDKIDKALARRLATCGKVGVARLLTRRYKLAHAMLTDTAKLKSYNRIKELLIKDKAFTTIRYSNGFYEGQVMNLLNVGFVRSGKGLTMLRSKERYEGQYKEDMRHGIGVQFWSNGDVYVGQWFKNLMSGNGIYYYNTGAVYSGPFLLGKRHGHGRLEWRSSAVYIGQFEEDFRTGHGYLRHPSRNGPDVRYIGGWLKNRKHGHGTYESETEGSYTGEFKDDQFEGKGTLRLDTGDLYQGQFHQGRLNGKCILEWSNGDRYTGSMWRNAIDGNGEMIYLSTDQVYTGQWKEFSPHGRGVLVMEDNHEYDGDFAEGLMHGKGTYSWPSGCLYKGDFAKGARDGNAHIDFPSGGTWEGKYMQDVRHGKAHAQAELEAHLEMWRFGKLVERGQTNVVATNPVVDDVEAWEAIQVFDLQAEAAVDDLVLARPPERPPSGRRPHAGTEHDIMFGQRTTGPDMDGSQTDP